MHAVLEIASGSQKGKTLEVKPGETLKVGRHDQANLALREDAMMSNVHFALECDDEHCRIRDLQSRFGTQVNQKRVTEAVVQDGDRIVAGSTTFVVRIISKPASSEPPVPVPVHYETASPARVERTLETIADKGRKESAKELEKIHARVLQVLRQQTEPLYALLDAARDPLVLARLLHSGEEYQTLYEGPKGEALAESGPFLVKLPKQSTFLETLVREAWGKSWGFYFTCNRPFKEVRRHFRHFLLVKIPDGWQVYFRFYDPRVLRVFLPVCSTDEIKQFFGPVECYLTEGKEPALLLKYTTTLHGINERVVSLLVA